MAFIRQVSTASGATAVQIAEYTGGGQQRIVTHVGSAHSEAELGVLLAKARELLDDPRQQVLDIDADEQFTVSRLVGKPSAPSLFPAVQPVTFVARAGSG